MTAGANREAAAATAECWPQFQYDARNAGAAPDNTGPVDGVAERWRFQAGKKFHTSPAVVASTPNAPGGTVYVGNSDGYLYALDARTGDQRWRFDAGGKPTSPAVVDGTVYVAIRAGDVYAVDAQSGEQRWRFSTVGSVHASPMVADGFLLVGTVVDDATSDEQALHALNAASGSERWRFEGARDVGGSAAVASSTVYVGNSDGGLYALDGDLGEVQWRFGTGAPVLAAPTVADGTVYVVNEDGALSAVGAESGEQRWRFDTGSTTYSSPAVVDGTVFAGTNDAGLFAIGADSGTERWQFETGREGAAWSPAVVDDTVYFGGGRYSGVLHAVAAASGEERWRFEPDERLSDAASPAVVGGTVYIGTVEGRFYALEAGSQRVLAPTSGPPLVPLAGGAGAVALGLGAGWWWRRRGRTGGAAAVTDASAGGTGAAPSNGGADGPPEQIPRAPIMDVDYGALVDEEPIGSGGNADVKRAVLPTAEGDLPLAVKTPRMAGTLHAEAVERLLDEAETWARLDDHDHVVGVVDYGAEPVPWIAMEYMDAGHLGERAGGLPLDQALWTAIAVTRAVRHAHRRGVAHLDLKPANVLFRSIEGAWPVPKVGDWGLSRRLLDHAGSADGLSPQYAAPEQFDEGYGEPDDLTDVYQLGAVFYELFTGRPPFTGPPTKVMRAVLEDRPRPPSELADLPAALDDVLLGALARHKADRYESVLLLRDALQDIYDTER